MSNNNKESLKNSLGLTVYPWSSDDEDTGTQPAPEDNVMRRPFAEQSEITPIIEPQTSNSYLNFRTMSVQPLSPSLVAQRAQAKRDRIHYWSLLNRQSDSAPSTSRSSRDPNVPQHYESRMVICGRGSSDRMKSDLQRIIAFKRFKNQLNNYRASRLSSSSLYPLHEEQPSTSSSASPAASSSRRHWPSSLSGARSHAPEPDMANEDAPSVDPRSPIAGETPTIPNDIMTLDDIVVIEPETEASNNPSTSRDDQHELNRTNEEQAVENSSSEVTPQSRGVKRKHEGSDDDAEPTTLKDLNMGLLRILECPVCLEWLEPPMAQCRRGHLVCSRCRERIASCPVCRTSFSSVRNRAMEAVAEMLRYPCRHGCGREVRLKRRTPHEASCEARRYLCPAPACTDTQRAHSHTDLHSHLLSEHPELVKHGTQHSFSLKLTSNKQHEHWFVMALQEVFHVRVDVDVRTWGVVVYVAYIGPKCNAHQYTYEVTVVGQNNARKLVYTRAAHSDLENYFVNLSRQDCFQMSFDQALKFLHFKYRQEILDKFFNFSLEVTKIDVAVEANLETNNSCARTS